MLKLSRSCLLAVLLVLASGCGDSDKAAKTKDAAKLGLSEEAVALLRHVPADTPYIVATVDPLPEDIMRSLKPRIDKVLKAYGSVVESLFAEIEQKQRDKGATDDDVARAAAVMQEMAAVMSVDGLESIGLELNTRSVLYGNGLLPVMRVQAADPQKLEAAIARFEEKAGHKMAVAEIDGHSYRYAGDEKVRVILAVMGDQLVLAMLPTAASDETLKATLGLSLPARNLGESDALVELARTQGYLLTSVGFFDTVRIASTFVEDQTGTDKELLGLLEYDNASLSDDCRREITEMANVMPRMTFGYTHIDEQQFDAKMVMELRSDLATGLQKIAAPVPGMDDMGGVVAFGLSFDLLAARDFMGQRLAALEAKPFKCEFFNDMQQSVVAGKAALDQPLPPVAYSIKGFSMALDSFDGLDMSGKSVPTSAELRGILAVEDAQALLAMGQMFSPQLAALPLKPDGKAVQVAAGTVPGVTNPIFLAMSESAIAFSMGKGLEAQLPVMLAATVPTYPPLVSLSYDAAAYFDLMGAAMQAGIDQAPDDEPQPSAEAMAGVTDALAQIMDRVSMQILLTEQGVEMPYTITLP